MVDKMNTDFSEKEEKLKNSKDKLLKLKKQFNQEEYNRIFEEEKSNHIHSSTEWVENESVECNSSSINKEELHTVNPDIHLERVIKTTSPSTKTSSSFTIPVLYILLFFAVCYVIYTAYKL